MAVNDIYDRITKIASKETGSINETIKEYNEKVKKYNEYMNGLLDEIKDINTDLSNKLQYSDEKVKLIEDKINDFQIKYVRQNEILNEGIVKNIDSIPGREETGFDVYETYKDNSLYGVPGLKLKEIFYQKDIYCVFGIDYDNNLWVCGKNSYGEAGLGHKNPVKCFTQVFKEDGEPLKVKYVYAGKIYVLVIDLNDSLWAVGMNSDGFLGLGNDIEESLYFTQIPELKNNVKTIVNNEETIGNNVFSHYSNYIIDKNDKLWFSGYDYISKNNTNNFVKIFDDKKVKRVFANPTKTISDDNINFTFYIIDEFDKLWVLGDNSYGLLGTGNLNDKKILEITQINNIDNIETIWSNHSGEYTILLTKDGEIYVTGVNNNGTTHENILGIESEGNYIYEWTKIDYLGVKIKDFIISNYFIALIDENNNVWISNSLITGNSQFKKIGDFKAKNLDYKIYEYYYYYNESGNKSSILPFSFLYNIFLLDENDSLYGYGNNTNGVFGQGNEEKYIDNFVKIKDNIKDYYPTISDTGYCSLIMIDKNNDIYVTGKNYNSCLGIGDPNVIYNTPTKIENFKAEKVFVSESSYLGSIVQLTNKEIITTGKNRDGMLSDGTTTQINTWKKVSDLYVSLYNYVNIEAKLPFIKEFKMDENGFITRNTETDLYKYPTKNFKLFNDVGMTKELGETELFALKLESSIPFKEDSSFVGRIKKDNDFKVVEFGLSYVQYNKRHFSDDEFNYDERYYKGDIANDNIITRFYRGIIFFKNVLDRRDDIYKKYAAYLLCPDPELNGDIKSTVGPLFNIHFKEDDEYIYLVFDNFLPYRIDWDETDNSITPFDMYDKDRAGNSYINFEVWGILSDLSNFNYENGFYDMGTTLKEINESEKIYDSKYRDLTIKPLSNGFVKYIGLDLNTYSNLATTFNLKEKSYYFNSHGVTSTLKDEGFNNTERRDIVDLFERIVNDNNWFTHKISENGEEITPDNEPGSGSDYFPSYEDPVSINDFIISDDENVVFATNFGLYKIDFNLNEIIILHHNLYEQTINNDKISERNRRSPNILLLDKTVNDDMVSITRDYKIISDGHIYNNSEFSALPEPIVPNPDFEINTNNYIIKYEKNNELIIIIKNNPGDNRLTIITKDNYVTNIDFSGNIKEYKDLSIDPVIVTKNKIVIIMTNEIKVWTINENSTEYSLKNISISENNIDMNLNGLFEYNEDIYVIFGKNDSSGKLGYFVYKNDEIYDISYIENEIFTDLVSGCNHQFFYLPTFKNGISMIDTINNKIYLNINLEKLLNNTLTVDDMNILQIENILPDNENINKFNYTKCNRTIIKTDKENRFVCLSGNKLYRLRPYKIGRIKTFKEIKDEIKSILKKEKDKRGNQNFIPYRIDVKTNKNHLNEINYGLISDSSLTEIGFFNNKEISEFDYELFDSDPFITLFKKKKNPKDSVIISGQFYEYATQSIERSYTKLSNFGYNISRFCDGYFCKRKKIDWKSNSFFVGSTFSIMIDDNNKIIGMGKNISRVLSSYTDPSVTFKTPVELNISSSLESNYNFKFDPKKVYVFINHDIQSETKEAYIVVITKTNDVLIRGHFIDENIHFIYCEKLPENETFYDIILCKDLVFIITTDENMSKKYYTIGDTTNILYDERNITDTVSKKILKEYPSEYFVETPSKFITGYSEFICYSNATNDKLYRAKDKSIALDVLTDYEDEVKEFVKVYTNDRNDRILFIDKNNKLIQFNTYDKHIDNYGANIKSVNVRNPGYNEEYTDIYNRKYIRGVCSCFGKTTYVDKPGRIDFKIDEIDNSTNIVDSIIASNKSLLKDSDNNYYYSSGIPEFKNLPYVSQSSYPETIDESYDEMNNEIKDFATNCTNDLNELNIRYNEYSECIDIPYFKKINFEELSDGNITNENIKKIELGMFLLFVLTNDNDLYAYGFDFFGESGKEEYYRTYLNKFTLISRNVQNIYSKRGRTFIIINEDGINKLYASGCNAYGALGTSKNYSVNKTWYDLSESVDILSDTIKEIIFFRFNTFILTFGGYVYATGYNRFGECGVGNDTNLYNFTKCLVENCEYFYTLNTSDLCKANYFYCGDYNNIYLTGRNYNKRLGLESDEGKDYIMTPKRIELSEPTEKMKEFLETVEFERCLAYYNPINNNDETKFHVYCTFIKKNNFDFNKRQRFNIITKENRVNWEWETDENLENLIQTNELKAIYKNKTWYYYYKDTNELRKEIRLRYNYLIATNTSIPYNLDTGGFTNPDLTRFLIKDFIPVDDDLNLVKCITNNNRVLLLFYKDFHELSSNKFLTNISINSAGSGIGYGDYISAIANNRIKNSGVSNNYLYYTPITGYSYCIDKPINDKVDFVAQQRIFEYYNNKKCKTVKEIKEDLSEMYNIPKFRRTNELLKDIEEVLDNDDNSNTLFSVRLIIYPFIVKDCETMKFGVNGVNNYYNDEYFKKLT